MQLAGGAAVVAGARWSCRATRTRRGARRRRRRGAALAARLARARRSGSASLIPRWRAWSRRSASIGAVGAVYLADIVIGLPLALLFRIGLRLPGAAAWPALLAAGLFETAGFACIAAGSRFAPIALVSPLASLASALTVAVRLGGAARAPARAVLAGAALVCAGVVALSL